MAFTIQTFSGDCQVPNQPNWTKEFETKDEAVRAATEQQQSLILWSNLPLDDGIFTIVSADEDTYIHWIIFGTQGDIIDDLDGATEKMFELMGAD